MPPTFPAAADTQSLEQGQVLTPRFDGNGLIAAIATDAVSGDVLMFAWMNADALSRSIETGLAHFWSRSRGKLWKKGEESGNELEIEEMRVDCDQDAIWMKVRVHGKGAACHTGARSCFYRRVASGDGQEVRLQPVPAATQR
jgi:phosphoribosyl-AMP cyclohydrolase